MQKIMAKVAQMHGNKILIEEHGTPSSRKRLVLRQDDAARLTKSGAYLENRITIDIDDGGENLDRLIAHLTALRRIYARNKTFPWSHDLVDLPKAI